MEIQVVQIGNSKGIRLSKTLIDKYHIKDKVVLRLEKDQIVLKSVTTPRKGWDKAFKAMHENGDDKLFINDLFNDETLEEWS
jgi:antitoxin MazE